MLRVTRLEDAIAKGDTSLDKLAWKPTDELGSFQHDYYGGVLRTAVYDEEGNYLFDSYQITEGPGSIVVPWEIDDSKQVRVGIIDSYRHNPGKSFFELPRGLAEKDEDVLTAAYRELLEETQLESSDAFDLAILGRTSVNTAFYTTDIPILAIRFPSITEIMNPAANPTIEKIASVKPYTKKEITDVIFSGGKTSCGLTSDALLRFTHYLTKQHSDAKF